MGKKKPHSLHVPPPEITEAEKLPAIKRRKRRNHWNPLGDTSHTWVSDQQEARARERVIEYHQRAAEGRGRNSE